MEAKRILEEIEERIKRHYLLSKIHKRGDGYYIDLKEKHGEDIVLIGINLVEMYKMLKKKGDKDVYTGAFTHKKLGK